MISSASRAWNSPNRVLVARTAGLVTKPLVPHDLAPHRLPVVRLTSSLPALALKLRRIVVRTLVGALPVKLSSERAAARTARWLAGCLV